MREFAELQVQHFLEQLADHALGQAHDLGLVQEAGLDVDLGEFWLAIGTQVFVTEALGNLVVAVETGDHQQLLEQLWRLRQCEEAAGVGAAWHQVIARAFRRGAGQNRRFHIEEAVFVEKASNAAGDARAQAQLVGHLRTTQVDETVAQTRFLTNVGVFVERERRGFGFVQHVELIAEDFDGTGGHVAVHSTFRATADLAGDLHDVLAAYTVGCGEGVGAIRIENDLGHALAVTDVEEDHPAVVPATMDPAAKGDFLAVQALVQLAAIMAAHHDGGFASRDSCIRWRPWPPGGLILQDPVIAFNSVGLVAACQILFRTGLEVGFVPAVAAQAKAGHRQQFLHRRRLAGRAVGERRGADFLQHFHAMLAGCTLIVVKGHGCLSSTITLAAWAAKGGIIYG